MHSCCPALLFLFRCQLLSSVSPLLFRKVSRLTHCSYLAGDGVGASLKDHSTLCAVLLGQNHERRGTQPAGRGEKGMAKGQAVWILRQA